MEFTETKDNYSVLFSTQSYCDHLKNIDAEEVWWRLPSSVTTLGTVEAIKLEKTTAVSNRQKKHLFYKQYGYYKYKTKSFLKKTKTDSVIEPFSLFSSTFLFEKPEQQQQQQAYQFYAPFTQNDIFSNYRTIFCMQ